MTVPANDYNVLSTINDTIKALSMKDIKVFFMVLILIIPFFLPAVEMWQVTFVEKPQLIIISFINYKHWNLINT